MDGLKEGAAQCGFESGEKAELAVGGFISVLKKSENIQDDKVDSITEALEAKEFIEEYEKLEQLKFVPKPNPIKQILKPGPPVGTVAKALARAIIRKSRDDKDALHTEDCVGILKIKNWMKEEEILDFMKVFIAFVQENHEIDISEILCLPADKKEEEKE